MKVAGPPVARYLEGMTTATSKALLRTPFYQYHIDHGAKMVEFAGWEMPIRYGSIIEEHRHVRNSGGVFDVSHMGRLRFRGRDSRAFLDRVCTRQIFGMADGQCRYSLICNERGGCRDDVIISRLGEDDYLMVCNAANRLKLLEHFAQEKGDHVFKLEDQTLAGAMVALQGPKVIELLGRYSSSIPKLKRFRFVQLNLLALQLIISRTGYTGDDGVEVIFAGGGKIASSLLNQLLKQIDGASAVIKPAGLGARDTLRIEAAMPLYGHEISEERDPLSAGLTFAVKVDKGDDDEQIGRFIGQDALRKIAEHGPRQRLVGLVLDGRRSARQHMPVLRGDDTVGSVTSGGVSPTLGKSIAMAYVEAGHAEPGTALRVDLGRAVADAEVVKLPFYKAG